MEDYQQNRFVPTIIIRKQINHHLEEENNTETTQKKYWSRDQWWR